MTRYSKDYQEALRTIDSAQLCAIENTDLCVFVSASIDPDNAARYTLQRVSQRAEHSTVEETLRLLRSGLILLAMKSKWIARSKLPLVAGHLQS